MGTKLTHASRTELADSLRQRYQSSSGKTKKLILSEFIASTGYHPKYALQLLNAEGTALPSDRRPAIGRASTTMRHARRSSFCGRRPTGSAGSGCGRCCASCCQLLSVTVT